MQSSSAHGLYRLSCAIPIWTTDNHAHEIGSQLSDNSVAKKTSKVVGREIPSVLTPSAIMSNEPPGFPRRRPTLKQFFYSIDNDHSYPNQAFPGLSQRYQHRILHSYAKMTDLPAQLEARYQVWL